MTPRKREMTLRNVAPKLVLPILVNFGMIEEIQHC